MLLFIIILFLPKLYKMFSYIQHINNIVGIEEFTRKSYNKLEKIILFRKKTSVYIKTIFFTKQGWIIKNYKLAIFTGVWQELQPLEWCRLIALFPSYF